MLLATIGDNTVETLYSNRVTSENIRIHTPSPVPSIQSWDVSCFLKVARTVAQHCMEGMGEEELSFPLLKSGKCQKAHLGWSVSTHFVVDCSLTMSFWKLGKKNKRTKKLSLTCNPSFYPFYFFSSWALLSS